MQNEHDDCDSDGEHSSLEMFRDIQGSDLEANVSQGAANEDSATEAPLRRIFAVSGAKGGIGKTVFATNLAIYLSTLGKRTLIVDADSACSNAHTLLGLDPRPARHLPPTAAKVASHAPVDPAAAIEPVETPIHGLKLLCAHMDEPMGGAARTARRNRLEEWLSSSDADYIVLDLGSGTDHALVDLYLHAHLSVFITLPEPTSVEATYRFMRAAFTRLLRAKVQDSPERKRLEHYLHRFSHPPAPSDLLQLVQSEHDPLQSTVEETLRTFIPRIIVNQARVRSDLDLGEGIRHAARHRVGVWVDHLGSIDYDDAVWSCVRSRRPLMIESPGAKVSKGIERIARRLLAMDNGKAPRITGPSAPWGSHYEFLGVGRGATDEEVRRATKRMRDLYASDGMAWYGLLHPSELEQMRVRLEEAYDVLIDPLKRRPYELSVFPNSHLSTHSEDVDAEEKSLPDAPLVNPDTIFSGALLQAVRQSQGLSLQEISRSTKIGSGYLEAIEDDNFSRLPAAVYVRGFVIELAKYLKLDPVQVSQTYMKRMRTHARTLAKPIAS